MTTGETRQKAKRKDVDSQFMADSLVWKYWEAVLETGEKESHCE
jgi:hypothetical protein